MNDQVEDYGWRDSISDRYRWMAFAALVAIVITLEFTLGGWLEAERVANITANAQNWAMADLRIGHSERLIHSKRAGIKRLLYVSNSHAKSGGHVAYHLQKLLDRAAPGEFEVLDMAEPGIFAPDILQRTLRGLDYQPDLVILGVSYITFGDRMRLALQAHSVRSFFNAGTFPRLPIGFWLRNYDLGLFGDTLVNRFSNLYRNRNAVRDLWEQPLAGNLKYLIGDSRPVWMLEFAESTRWRFPDGYDNNLFQWSLYAANRAGHVADMRALVQLLAEAGVPLLALNLPIDFAKSTHSYNTEDFSRYRQEMREIFVNALAYIDYEEFFPKDFSTYDALHPTWHGARLHAFDLLLRLAEHGYFAGPMSPENLLAIFNESDEAISADYQAALDGNYPPHEAWWTFRRFDLSEPANARDLMQRLARVRPGSHDYHQLINGLALRIRYWNQNNFTIKTRSASVFNRVWESAVLTEFARSQKRINYFQQRLIEYEHQQLEQFPLPDLANAQLIQQNSQLVQQTGQSGSGTKAMLISHYMLMDGRVAFSVSTVDRRLVALGMDGNPGYLRVDTLGDGSFLELRPMGPFILPSWVHETQPSARWGI